MTDGKFKKGFTPWNKGKSGYKNFYPKNRKKVGTRKKGYKHTEDAKKRMSKNRSGSNNGSWKGGITPETRKQRNSVQIKLLREKCFKRDKWTCQECGARSVYIEAHHLKSWARYPELRFVLENLQTLCKECHQKTDSYKGKNKKLIIN